jgi:iron complex outermembrane receptor protein
MVEPNPLPDSAKIHGEANLVGFSNGQQGIASGIIEGGLPKKGWAWRLQGTYKEVPTSKRQTII